MLEVSKRLIALFDDVVDEEDGRWSQICSTCVATLDVPETMLDNTGQGICGVEGCNNEACYYVDFK